MIDEIIQREWEFFQNVQHIDGRASCQDDFDTFYKQRKSQFVVFSKELQASYLQDLKDYQEIGRNPVMEKYAYMMETSDPEYYVTIQSSLPVIDDLQKNIIQTICEIQVTMREEFNDHYPILASLSRLTHTAEDEKEDTSFETYLRGELMTYSPTTLSLYGKMVLQMLENHKNMTELIMMNTVKEYGYQSLEEAEQKMKERMI